MLVEKIKLIEVKEVLVKNSKLNEVIKELAPLSLQNAIASFDEDGSENQVSITFLTEIDEIIEDYKAGAAGEDCENYPNFNEEITEGIEYLYEIKKLLIEVQKAGYSFVTIQEG